MRVVRESNANLELEAYCHQFRKYDEQTLLSAIQALTLYVIVTASDGNRCRLISIVVRIAMGVSSSTPSLQCILPTKTICWHSMCSGTSKWSKSKRISLYKRSKGKLSKLWRLDTKGEQKKVKNLRIYDRTHSSVHAILIHTLKELWSCYISWKGFSTWALEHLPRLGALYLKIFHFPAANCFGKLTPRRNGSVNIRNTFRKGKVADCWWPGRCANRQNLMWAA